LFSISQGRTHHFFIFYLNLPGLFESRYFFLRRFIWGVLRTSFNSKQPKLEPKLVSALSETKRVFQLFRFYTATENFGVSVELKQTKEQPKLFDREHILVFFLNISGCFSGCFGLFRNNLFRLFYQNSHFRCFDWTEKTEDQPKQFDWEHILVFFRKFRVVSVVCLDCFDIGSKHQNKPKFFVFGFTKQTQTQPKQILFRFVSVRRTPFNH
jgi:hypothetical protein